MSEINIEASNLVILGSWNPAIISPQWLRQQLPALFPHEQFFAEMLMGPIASMRFTMEKITIDPSGGRLLLSPATGADASIFDSIAALALEIFKRLPHTPIIAVGHNFSFTLQPNQTFKVEGLFAPPDEQKTLLHGLEVTSFLGAHLRHSFAIPNGQLNIDYDLPPAGRTFSLNYHYPANDASSTEGAIGKLPANYTHALLLGAELINTEQ